MSSPPDTPASPASSDHDALPPGTRFGEFEILRVIGIGGFGIVYLARDHSLERDVALKEYMPSTLASRGEGPQVTVRSSAQAETYAIGLRSFINEARLLARFDHPSLVKVYRFWEDNRTAYMVMPYLQGVTLRDTRRAMAHAPDEAWIRRVIDPVMSALELLHREGVFHRDIAPDNILLPPEGPPVLLDFGAARRVISDRTQSLTAILKPSYAPIEQYAEMSQLRQGPWTDIYALGAVVHYLLFNKPPQPATARALEPDGDTVAGRTVEGVSSRFLEAMDWALAVRPGRRPQSIAELRGALDGIVAIPVRDSQPVTLPGALAPAPPAAPSGDADAPTRRVDTSSHATVQWTAPPATSQPPRTPAGTIPPSTVAPPAPEPIDSGAWASTAYSPRTSQGIPTGAHTTAPSWPPTPTAPGTPLPAPTPEARKAAAAAIRSTIFPRPPAPPPPAPRWKNVVAYSVIGALFVLVIVLAAWLVLDDRKPERRTAAAAGPGPGASAAVTAGTSASQPPIDATAQLPPSTNTAGAALPASPPASTVAASAANAVESASSAGPLVPSGAAVAMNAASAVVPAAAASSSASSAATRVAAAASGASAPVRVRTPGAGARPDGALRPLPGSEHPYDTTAPVTGGVTADARPRPPSTPAPTLQATPQGPASAGDACRGLGFIARAVCMDRECDSARFRDTAECVPVLARKRLREGR